MGRNVADPGGWMRPACALVTVCKLGRRTFGRVAGERGDMFIRRASREAMQEFTGYDARTLTTTELRDGLSEALRIIEIDGDRVVITRHGREVAGLCRVTDLAMIREWYQKSAREKELEMQIALEGWRRAQAGGRDWG